MRLGNLSAGNALERWLETAILRLEHAVDAIARRRLLACLAIGFLALGLRLAVLPFHPIPKPVVEDEFSYLLQGETFASGRLTNPTHPLWPFFETIHVNQQPTYASKYPPGQGLFLALGIRLFGRAWFGVWLSVGIMCACICWMVQGWLPDRYALYAGVVAALQFCNGSWMNSYWGGAVAAIGGAMVLGAIPRLRRRPSATVAAVGALGVVILMNSRPYEGLIVAVLSLGALLGTKALQRLFHTRLIATVVAVLVLGAALTIYYDWRLTGSAFELPYAIHQRRYALAPVFWLQRPLETGHQIYRDSAMMRLWQWDAALYRAARNNPLKVVNSLAWACAIEFINGPMLIFLPIAALGIGTAVRSRRLFPAVAIGALFVAAVLMEKFILAHYLAPAVALLFLFTAAGIRVVRLRKLNHGRAGRIVPGAALAASMVLFFAVSRPGLPTPSAVLVREAAETALQRMPGSHVVLVHYSPNHDPHAEIVYNGPDIDRQKIVWAIDRGRPDNDTLQRYYSNRRIWLVEPDEPNASLRPYLRSRLPTEPALVP